MTPPWQFTMWLDLLDHWQTLAAGFLAMAAALVAGFFALKAASIVVQAARQQERREVEAIRLSLAVEIRHLVKVLLQTHGDFGIVSSAGSPRADDVVKATSRGVPVVYPATADRVGLLGCVAPYVVTFYANLKDIEYAGRMTASGPAEHVPPDDLRALMKLIEDACRQSALPLLSKLPWDGLCG